MSRLSSIYHLRKAFDIHSIVGGGCGEFIAPKDKYGEKFLDPLVATQNFEDRNKWVFRTKRNADGSADKYKARLAQRGSRKSKASTTSTPTLSSQDLPASEPYFALAARQDWDVESVDFNGAYFNRQIDDDGIHMQEPLGYETAQGSVSVKQLRTSLYGLKQAGCK